MLQCIFQWISILAQLGHNVERWKLDAVMFYLCTLLSVSGRWGCILKLHTVEQETKFQINVRENVNEEKQNQLRWQVKLGEDVATFEQQAKVLEDRIDDWKVYKVRTLMSWLLIHIVCHRTETANRHYVYTQCAKKSQCNLKHYIS